MQGTTFLIHLDFLLKELFSVLCNHSVPADFNLHAEFIFYPP